jgi:short-subunit dehydrogenase
VYVLEFDQRHSFNLSKDYGKDNINANTRYSVSRKRVLVLGASGGLGSALVKEMGSEVAVFVHGRRQDRLLFEQVEEKFVADVAEDSQVENLLQRMVDLDLDCVVNCVGGGPYGPYQSKQWKDHLWAFRVSLLFSARLAHWALAGGCRQLVLVGSAIAEDKADPWAASYAASKHGVAGLYKSVVAEMKAEPSSFKNSLDLRLFSPGYLDTSLLPPNAAVRQNSPERVRDVGAVAKQLWCWVQSDDHCGWLRYD